MKNKKTKQPRKNAIHFIGADRVIFTFNGKLEAAACVT
jgi:hypothetical protein